MPTQQMLLVGGKPPERTYLDEVFKITGYTGNGVSGSGTRTITHGLKYGDDGGMIMTKQTKNNQGSYQNWYVYSGSTWNGGSHKTNSGTYHDYAHTGGELTATNNTYQVTGTGFKHNANGKKYVNYMFKKTTGFFTHKQYTGSGSTQSLTHDLGVIPAMIWIHRGNAFNTTNWAVYHRNINKGVNPQNYRMWLNTNGTGVDEDQFGDTAPTATHFTVGGSHNETNANGDTYTAYFFAGAESTAATATSVALDGTGDYLDTDANSNYSMGTGDFTVEGWFRETADTSNTGLFQTDDGGSTGLSTTIGDFYTVWVQSDTFRFYAGGTEIDTGVKCAKDVWYHIALVRNSGKTRLYINGTATKTTNYQNYVADTVDHTANVWAFGGYYNTSYLMTGNISNIRIVKGTAVYTCNFRPSTEPLSSITNTKCLFAQGSSVTASTTSSETIRANGDPATSTDSPFDDPNAQIFGANGKEQIIKCGGYTGNGDTTNGTRIHLGFEPQLILIKSESFQEEWHIFDEMTGMKTNEDIRLELSQDGQGLTGSNFLHTDPLGFTALHNPNINKDGEYYIYMAIRREDGYVQKPADAGTDVFTMDTGNSSGDIPSMDTTFTVDMTIYRKPGSVAHNWLTARMLGTRDNGKELKINAAESEGSVGDSQWDTHVGWGQNHNGDYQAWMWKRCKGFDIVHYKADEVNGRFISHSLGIPPEMIWIKSRDNTYNWTVGHKALTGGDWGYYMKLHDTDAEANYPLFNDFTPTSTCFSTHNNSAVNWSGNYIAMLFASTDVSSVGSYVGASGSVTLNLGFEPRFFLCKRINDTGDWCMFDSLRGMSSTANVADYRIRLNSNVVHEGYDFIQTSGTGMTIEAGAHSDVLTTSSSDSWIYYAHA